MNARKIDSPLRKKFSPLRLECAKQLTVKDKGKVGSAKQITLLGRQALANRVRQAIEELSARRGKLSYAQIAERSGGLITEGAITNLLSQRVGNPTALTLFGLARALEIDAHELFDAALGIGEPKGFRESEWWQAKEACDSLLEERHRERVLNDVRDLILIIQAFPRKKADGHEAATIRHIR